MTLRWTSPDMRSLLRQDIFRGLWFVLASQSAHISGTLVKGGCQAPFDTDRIAQIAAAMPIALALKCHKACCVNK